MTIDWANVIKTKADDLALSPGCGQRVEDLLEPRPAKASVRRKVGATEDRLQRWGQEDA